MTDHEKEISSLAAEFERCRKILLALGDENRQHLMLEMMQMGECGGVRVGAVTEKTHLSRPAVSHHIQILKMDLKEAMKVRHSVRQYEVRPLEAETVSELEKEISICNKESGLHIQLVKNEPKAFDGFMAHYGKFSGVTNYIAMIGKKGPDLAEACGYYGERLVLKAQQLGLNTCWAAMTYNKIKTAFTVETDEKLCIVIALGYGKTNGVPHKSKSVDAVAKADGPLPDWFKAGAEAALLAPTAMNQQKFTFTLKGNEVSAKAGLGFYTKIDLGIAKYHFEYGAGTENFTWK